MIKEKKEDMIKEKEQKTKYPYPVRCPYCFLTFDYKEDYLKHFREHFKK